MDFKNAVANAVRGGSPEAVRAVCEKLLADAERVAAEAEAAAKAKAEAEAEATVQAQAFGAGSGFGTGAAGGSWTSSGSGFGTAAAASGFGGFGNAPTGGFQAFGNSGWGGGQWGGQPNPARPPEPPFTGQILFFAAWLPDMLQFLLEYVLCLCVLVIRVAGFCVCCCCSLMVHLLITWCPCVSLRVCAPGCMHCGARALACFQLAANNRCGSHPAKRGKHVARGGKTRTRRSRAIARQCARCPRGGHSSRTTSAR